MKDILGLWVFNLRGEEVRTERRRQLFIAKAYSCSGGSTHFITTQTAPPGKIASDPVSGLGVMGDREGDVWLADFGATYSYDW